MRKYMKQFALGVCVILVMVGCKKETTQELQVQTTVAVEESATIEPYTKETIEPYTTIPEIEEVETEEVETKEAETKEAETKEDTEITVMIATDMHYFSKSLTDGGSSFTDIVYYGDGKMVQYIEEIMDAFIEVVIVEQPDFLILPGDLTLEGEKVSHEELAEKLQKVEAVDIPVLVIPGNHDVNNVRASEYYGDSKIPAEYITPNQFEKIYQEFGYGDAISRDETTLSYVYQADETTRFLMLDSCQYQNGIRVGGVILDPTYEWIEKQLDDAWTNGMNVIAVAHHNLLEQSEVYVDDCTIEHSEYLIELLEDWDVTLFLSGHLHVQHAMRSEEDKGIWEIVTSAISTPDCKYGMLTFRSDATFSYETRTLDMETWAREQGNTEEELLEFDQWKQFFLQKVFYNESLQALQIIPRLEDEQREAMAELYANLKYHYYQGTAYQIKEEIEADPAYELWQGDGSFTIFTDYVTSIVNDATMDYNKIELESDE